MTDTERIGMMCEMGALATRIEKLEELVHQTAQLAALRGLYHHHQAWDSEREYLLRIAELRGELNLY